MANIITDPVKMRAIEDRVSELRRVLENAVVAHLADTPDSKYTFEELAQAHTECATSALRTSFRLTCKIDVEEVQPVCVNAHCKEHFGGPKDFGPHGR
jgi:hypothetical protein